MCFLTFKESCIVSPIPSLPKETHRLIICYFKNAYSLYNFSYTVDKMPFVPGCLQGRSDKV